MPFDVLPQEQEVKVGKYQDVADAILRGCSLHKNQAIEELYDRANEATCVIGAAFMGLGHDISRYENTAGCRHWATPIGRRLHELMNDYSMVYGVIPQTDNNTRHFTREQIAARIAAL